MSSLVRAGNVLGSEVAALRPKAKMKVVGDPDGLDRHRAVTYDATTMKWLAPLLEALEDPRIESVDDSGKSTVITFVSDTRADRGHPFGLATVDEVINE